MNGAMLQILAQGLFRKCKSILEYFRKSKSILEKVRGF